ncbi:hypothetical protein SASPL_131475 [Salvia splendens]|uniref:DUF547 domain-containing protein n=1 Tax=Salvia splendens TaxID=180675 RepID=A0A8X8ZKM5_SALSN|nr:hypothetical protein SASPL_131475 [Salvia splendens]
MTSLLSLPTESESIYHVCCCGSPSFTRILFAPPSPPDTDYFRHAIFGRRIPCPVPPCDSALLSVLPYSFIGILLANPNGLLLLLHLGIICSTCRPTPPHHLNPVRELEECIQRDQKLLGGENRGLDVYLTFTAKWATLHEAIKAIQLSSNSSFCSSGTFSPRNLSGSWSPQCHDEVSENYNIEGLKQDNDPYAAMVEVLKICLDDESYSYAAIMLQKFRSLVKSLENLDMKKMRHEQKLAFWINIHNALMMHWLQTLLLSPRRKFKTGVLRHAYAIDYPEPLVHFALSSGACSDPAIRIYYAKSISEDLNIAKEEFIQATAYVHKQKRLHLPKILQYYAKDMSLSTAALLKVVGDCLPEYQQKSIDRFLKGRPEKCLCWLEESSSFRYLIHKEIAATAW